MKCHYAVNVGVPKGGLLEWIILFLLFLSSMLATAAVPPAYTRIESSAHVKYFNNALNINERVDSNVVVVIIQPVVALELTSDSEMSTEIGSEVIFNHQLKNVSNIPVKPKLTWSTLSGSAFNLNGAKVFIDTNKNGIPDDGEPSFSSGDELPELAIGGTYYLIFLGSVPNTANINTQSKISLTASASASHATTGKPLTASSSVTDTVNVLPVGSLKVFKSSSQTEAKPNALIDYTLRAIQSVGADAEPIAIRIDGNLVNKVIFRDKIPRGTTFHNVTDAGGAQILYHDRSNTDEHSYTTAPLPLSKIDAVAFAFDKFYAGSVRQVTFNVRAKIALGRQVVNKFETYQTMNGKVQSVSSNLVVLKNNRHQHSLAFYNNSTFSPSLIVRPFAAGDTLFTQAIAPECDTDPTVREDYWLTVKSDVAGDVETNVHAVESAPDSGIFQSTIQTELWPEHPVKDNNGILQVAKDDLVRALLFCGGIPVEASAIIGKGSFISGNVFNSRKESEPIANAVVTLFTIDNGVEREIDKTTTGPLGHYSFSVANIGNLNHLVIKVSADAFKAPSRFAANIFGKRTVLDGASYAQAFRFNGSLMKIDIPMDPSGMQGIVIEKSVSKKKAKYGDMLIYTIKYTNKLNNITFTRVKLVDVLPRGFAYVPGSVKQNIEGGSNISRHGKHRLAEPIGSPGPNITFDLGYVGSSEQGTVSYAVKIRSSAPQGDAINRAQFVADEGYSNTSSARVTVEGGEFSDDAFITGAIYADCNGDLLKQKEEPGIPFVRIYMEDGTFVISDGEGRYSLYGLQPQTHVMKVDNTSLPTGAELVVLNNRFAKANGSQFVDLKKGELHRVDFAVKACTANLLSDIKARQDGWRNNELNQQLVSIVQNAAAKLDGSPLVDIRSRPAQGIVGPDGQLIAANGQQVQSTSGVPLPGTNMMQSQLISGTYNGGMAANTRQNNTYIPVGVNNAAMANPAAMTPVVLPALDKTMLAANNAPGFMYPNNGQAFLNNTIPVRVKGSVGATFQLFVNNKLIGNDRVGQKSRIVKHDLEAWEFVGVPLTPGKNELHVKVISKSGVLLGAQTVNVTAPGKLASIDITPVRPGLADGITPLPVMIRALDSDGNEVGARTPITIESASGLWDINDLNPMEPGIQTFIDGGKQSFNFYSGEPGEITVRVFSGPLTSLEVISFSANLRPLIAVGVIDGAIGLRKLPKDAVQGVNNNDNFQDTLRTVLGKEGNAGSLALRGALFVKGKVKGDYLLTLAYDSDKATKDQMFRDIDPNRFYPVYGDDSIKGFDAQSSGPLYVRVDKGRSYVMYGDYTTGDDNLFYGNAVQGKVLGNYSRSLTGGKGVYNNGKVKVSYFAAYTSNQQEITTFPGKGISGPYSVNFGDNFIDNSESVVVVTRSQAQPALIISEVQLTRFADYTVDIFGNTILFNRPIPSVDENGNPVEIRITYEVESGGKKYWVYGIDGELKITDSLTLGVGHVNDRDPAKNYQLDSVRLTQQFSPNTGLALEAAQSRSLTAGKGNAFRAEFVSKGNNFDARVYGVSVGDNFRNESVGITSGKQDVGAVANWRIDPRTAASVQGVYTKDKMTGNTRVGGLIVAERGLTPNLSARIGLRHVKDSTLITNPINGSAPVGQKLDDNVTSVLARLTWTPEKQPNFRAFIEGEQAINDKRRNMLALGAEYAVSSKVALYGRQEVVSKLGLGATDSVSGTYGLAGNSNRNRTTVGVKYNYAANSNIYSEYRILNAISGPQSEGAIGLNNGWTLTPGLTLTTTFEHTQPFSNNSGNGQSTIGYQESATAATVGLDYTANPNWKGSTRMEWRESDSQRSVLGSVGVAYKLDKDWTGLSSAIYATDLTKNTDQNRRRIDARIGAAYRDTETNKLSALFKYQYYADHDPANSNIQKANVVSVLGNYQYNQRLVLSGRYAMKWQSQSLEELRSRYFAQLIMGRFTYDINQNWDIGCMGAVLFGESASQNTLGCEVGYLIGTNIWLSAGYNALGFYDDVLTGTDYTQQGPYIRMRIKFDEDMLGWLAK